MTDLWITLWFVALVYIKNILGFAEFGFSASLTSDHSFSGWRHKKVEGWKVSGQEQGSLLGIALLEASSDVKITVSGIYLISSTVIIESAKTSGWFELSIVINDCEVSSSLVSRSEEEKKGKTLQASGLMNLNRGETVCVCISSNSSMSWTAKTGSSFSIGYLDKPWVSPAFSVYPKRTFLFGPDTNTDSSISGWTVGDRSGTFLSTSYFGSNRGDFSVPQDGVYFIAANIMIEKSKGNPKYFVTAFINYRKALETFKSGPNFVSNVTISLSAALFLRTGDRLTLRVRMLNGVVSSISSASSYSLGLLRAPGTQHIGFHISKASRKQMSAKGWTEITAESFNSNLSGGFIFFPDRTREFSQLNTPEDGMYYIAVHFRIITIDSIGALKLSLSINGRRTSSESLLSTSSSYHSQVRVVSFSGLLDLHRNDKVILHIYHPYESTWYVEALSTISFVKLVANYPAFSVCPSLTRQTWNSWLKVTNWKFQHDEYTFNFAKTFELSNGEYRIRVPGIYYISTNILFQDVTSSSVAACLAVNDKFSDADGLYASKSNIQGNATLNIASSIYLKKGWNISVYVKVENDDNGSVNPYSTFSLLYLGDRDLTIGFQTSILSDIKKTSSGWLTLQNWINPKLAYSPWSFRSESVFSHSTGMFTAPFSGFYLVTCNIIIGEADLMVDSSLFMVMVSIDENLSNDLMSAQRTAKLSPNQIDISNDISFTLSGIIKLNRGQTVAIKAFSRVDSSWIIRKKSGFSMVLLSKLQTPTIAGFMAGRSAERLLRPDKQTTVINWSAASTSNGQFIVASSSKLKDGTLISIKDPGLYFVATQIESLASASVELKLLFQKVGDKVQKMVCAMTTQMHRNDFLSCSMLVNVDRTSEFRVSLFSSFGSLHATVGRIGYLALVRVSPDSIEYPWVHAKLKKQVTQTGLQIKNWLTFGHGRLVTNHGSLMSSNNKEIIARTKGKYLVTTTVIIDGMPETRLKLEIHKGRTSRIMMGSFQKWNDSTTVSFARCLNLNKDDTLEFSTSSETASYTVNKETSLSAILLPKSSDIVVQDFYKKDESPAQILPKESRFNVKANNLYFISANLIGELSKHNKLFIEVTTGEDRAGLISIYEKKSAAVGTFVLSGVFRSFSESRGSVVFMTTTEDEPFKINKGSSITVIDFGLTSEQIYSIISMNDTELIMGKKNRWIDLKKLVSKFQSGVIFEDGVTVIRTTGLYLLTVNLIIESNTGAAYEVSLFVDEDGGSKGLYGKSMISLYGTIPMVATVMLQKGTRLKLFLRANTEDKFQVLAGTTWSLVLIKNLDYSASDKLSPVILHGIQPHSPTVIPMGHPHLLYCSAVGDGEIHYKWFRNDKLIMSEHKKYLRLDGNSTEAGLYRCEASSNKITAVSRSSEVQMYDVDECVLNENEICAGANQTCVNLPGSFKCQCDSGLQMQEGKCVALIGTSTAQRLPYANKVPKAVIVLCPIVGVVVLFVTAIAIYTCCKQRQKRRGRHTFTAEISNFNGFEQLIDEDTNMKETNNPVLSERSECYRPVEDGVPLEPWRTRRTHSTGSY